MRMLLNEHEEVQAVLRRKYGVRWDGYYPEVPRLSCKCTVGRGLQHLYEGWPELPFNATMDVLEFLPDARWHQPVCPLRCCCQESTTVAKIWGFSAGGGRL